MAKKKANGTKREKKAEQPAISIALIPIARFEGLLTPETALSWLHNDLPGFQALIRLGIDGGGELDGAHGTSDLAFGVERMTGACVGVIRDNKPVRIVPEEPESWSALRALDGVLGSLAGADWKPFLDAPHPDVLDAITRLVEGGIGEIEQAHAEKKAAEEVLDGKADEPWNLYDFTADLVRAIGKEGVMSLLCDFDSRKLRAFIRACHLTETDTPDQLRRALFGEAASNAEARA